MTLASGTRLGPYEIVESLGAGGMGEVYRAHDPRLRRDVAVKVILEAGESPSRDRLKRFEDEARAVGGLRWRRRQHPTLAHARGPTLPHVPYGELLERLRAVTNLRAIRDDEVPTGYRVEPGPFPGWEEAPGW